MQLMLSTLLFRTASELELRPQSKSKDAAFRRKIQELWLHWTDEADAAGLCVFYGLQALVFRSVIECGECFVRMKIDKKNATVPLKLQVLESEYLDSSKDQMLANGNVIRSGIEFDKTGKRVTYYLYKEHPGDSSFASLESVRIPAGEILHIYKPLRPGQIRGEPWLSNVLLKLHELDQYEGKKTAAMFAGFVTRLDPDSEMFGEREANNGGTAFTGLEPGTMLTGDLSSVNYSSIRAGLVEFRRKCASLTTSKKSTTKSKKKDAGKKKWD
jgi:lambda family phage portal protein